MNRIQPPSWEALALLYAGVIVFGLKVEEHLGTIELTPVTLLVLHTVLSTMATIAYLRLTYATARIDAVISRIPQR